jgi:hypothetical protein
MLHLDPERLAALADNEPTAEEIAHLAACRECARERAAYRELLSLASRTRTHTSKEPLTDWESLAPVLREEGLLRTMSEAAGRGGGRGGGRMRSWSHPWLQAAAAVLLAVGGGVIGRWSATGAPTGTGAAQLGQAPSGSVQGRLASAAPSADDSTRDFVSLDDALAVMARAESDYRLAAAYIATRDSSNNSRIGVDLYRTRLAALDKVSDAALAAVNEAPHDPVLNQYLISARSARDVTLQQLNSKLPPGVRLTSY